MQWPPLYPRSSLETGRLWGGQLNPVGHDTPPDVLDYPPLHATSPAAVSVSVFRGDFGKNADAAILYLEFSTSKLVRLGCAGEVLVVTSRGWSSRLARKAAESRNSGSFSIFISLFIHPSCVFYWPTSTVIHNDSNCYSSLRSKNWLHWPFKPCLRVSVRVSVCVWVCVSTMSVSMYPQRCA